MGLPERRETRSWNGRRQPDDGKEGASGGREAARRGFSDVWGGLVSLKCATEGKYASDESLRKVHERLAACDPPCLDPQAAAERRSRPAPSMHDPDFEPFWWEYGS